MQRVVLCGGMLLTCLTSCDDLGCCDCSCPPSAIDCEEAGGLDKLEERSIPLRDADFLPPDTAALSFSLAPPAAADLTLVLPSICRQLSTERWGERGRVGKEEGRRPVWGRSDERVGER